MKRAALVALAAVILLACSGTPPAAAPPRRAVSEVNLGSKENVDRLVEGLEAPNGDWRWTGPSFTILLDPPQTAGTVTLELDYSIAAEIVHAPSGVTLRARVNDIDLPPETYTASGRYTFSREVPTEALRTSPARVQFRVERNGAPVNEPRALMVVRAGLYEDTETEAWQTRVLNAGRAEYARIYRDHPAGLSLEQDAALKRLFHELPVWESLQFQGIGILKGPLDLWIMQDLIAEIRPDFIVETGTYLGGSALFWASQFESLGLENSRVLTIDIQDLQQRAARHPLWTKHVDFYLGSSVDGDIVRDIERRVGGKKVLVVLDALHTASHVLKELHAYAPMVSPGSYIVVEDTHLDGVPTNVGQGAGPFGAVTEFLGTGGNRDFEQDFSREALGITWNPGGWLRRKRD